MKTKFIQASLILFAVQFLTSCLDSNCGGGGVTEINYESVTLKTYDTSGFGPSDPVTDSVSYNTFGLELILIVAEPDEQVAINSMGGFYAAQACEPPHYIFDAVQSIELNATDPATMETFSVTQYFGSYDVGQREYVSVDKAVGDAYDSKSRFEFKLMEKEEIPEAATFSVTVQLQSGKTLTTETAVIHFY